MRDFRSNWRYVLHDIENLLQGIQEVCGYIDDNRIYEEGTPPQLSANSAKVGVSQNVTKKREVCVSRDSCSHGSFSED